MTHTLKFLLLSMMAVISLSIFTSCETDEDIGYGLSGPNGITWYGDFGASDYYGWALYSEITFISGYNADHGIGRETLYYQDTLEYYSTENFDWSIENGILYISYADHGLRIHDYYVGNRVFTGYFDDGFRFEMYLDRIW